MAEYLDFYVDIRPKYSHNNAMIPRYLYKDYCPDPDFRFHIFYGRFGASPVYELHSHEFGELVIVRRGYCNHVYEETKYPLVAGDVFYVKPDEVHGYHDLSPDFAYCNAIFDPAQFLESYPELLGMPGYHALFHVEPLLRVDHRFASKLHLEGEPLRQAFDIVETLRSEYEEGRAGRKTLIQCLLVQMVVSLARQRSQFQSTARHTVLRLSQAISFIELNYTETIALEDIVEAACMSKSSLLRWFQQCYKTSPLRYLRDHRLSKASDRLRQTKDSITDIALSVGFSDSNYFGRAFQQHYGLSPREYRREASPSVVIHK